MTRCRHGRGPRRVLVERRASGATPECCVSPGPCHRRLAEPLHALVRETAPELVPRLWYSQPAYAKDGRVVVFFRGADHDGERYLTLGFSQHAPLDDGGMWPTAYALTELGPAERTRIAALVTAAAG